MVWGRDSHLGDLNEAMETEVMTWKALIRETEEKDLQQNVENIQYLKNRFKRG